MDTMLWLMTTWLCAHRSGYCLLGITDLQDQVSAASSCALGVLHGGLHTDSWVSVLFVEHMCDVRTCLVHMQVIIFAFSSYMLADSFGLSGIVSILFCGLVCTCVLRQCVEHCSIP